MRSAPGLLLGFALGGFFDGILLHQILQWHHLLSAVGPADVTFQVAADGWFHALMYVIAAAGLWLLWREHRRGPGRAGRRLVSDMLIGFGAWHVLDSVLSHWVLGIHRIRMDSADPLLWDLIWFAAFGLAPLALGWALRRGRRGGGGSIIAAGLAAGLVLGAGAQALKPPPGGLSTVAFAPGVDGSEAALAIAQAGGRLAWMDAGGRLAVVELDGPAAALSLYARGALIVAGSGLPAGCFAYTRTA